MLEVRPLDGAAGVAGSGFLECTTGVAGVEEGRVAVVGVEGVWIEEGALVFGVEEVGVVVPAIPFLQA